MIIYGDMGSSNTRRVLTVLMHIGCEYDFRLLNLFEGENKLPSYLALNPNGAIPVMVDDDFVLYEASAIMLYVSSKYGKSLLPDGAAYFETLKWMFWAAEHFRRGPADLIDERFIKRAHHQPEDQNVCLRSEAHIHRYSSVLEKHMQNRRFVVGDRPTLADIDLAAPFSHVARTRAPFGDYPSVMSWHDRLLTEFPAWRKTGELLESRIAEIETRYLNIPHVVRR